MIDPELKAVVERLSRAGTVFECVCVSLPSRKPLPNPSAEVLTSLTPCTWDAEWVPFFALLDSKHPDAVFVSEVSAKFYADPVYARRLSDTAAEIDCDAQEAAFLVGDDDSDWEF